MYLLGLLCLGGFVGAIATIGIRFIKDGDSWKQGLAVMIASTLSGSAVVFVDKFRESGALGAYPVGLLVAMMWAYTDVAVANITSSEKIKIALGRAHLAAVSLITLGAAVLVLPAAIRDAGTFSGPKACVTPKPADSIVPPASTKPVQPSPAAPHPAS